MKKILLFGGLAFGVYALFLKGDDAGATQEPQETEIENEVPYRPLTDAEALNYLNQNSDLMQAFGKDLAKAKWHWEIQGYTEYLNGERALAYLS